MSRISLSNVASTNFWVGDGQSDRVPGGFSLNQTIQNCLTVAFRPDQIFDKFLKRFLAGLHYIYVAYIAGSR